MTSMKIAGQIIEVGQLDGEGAEFGVVIERPDGRFVTVKGLTEDETRALAKCLYKVALLAISG